MTDQRLLIPLAELPGLGPVGLPVEWRHDGDYTRGVVDALALAAVLRHVGGAT